MSEHRKKSGSSGGAQGGQESSARAALGRDPRANRLLGAGSRLGNEELQKRLGANNASRDELLAFIVKRLENVRETQRRELHESKPDVMRQDFKKIADSHKPEYSKPEPTKWRETAKVYEQAAYHLCRGDVRRGAELMKRAIEVEKTAFAQVSKHIDLDEVEKESEAPDALAAIVGQAASSCDVPPAISELVHKIDIVTDQPRDPYVPKRVKDPIWDEEEEEEEKPEGEGG